MSNQFGVKKAIGNLENYLTQNEKCIQLLSGQIRGNKLATNGLLALTTGRVIYLHERMGSTLIDLPLDHITSITYSKRAIGLGSILIVVPSQSIDLYSIDPKRGQGFVEAVRNQASQKQLGSAQPASEADPLDRLKKLGDLRDAGLLTEEEFARQKAKILD